MRKKLRASAMLVATAVRTDPRRSLAVLILEPIGQAGMAVMAFGVKVITDAAVAGEVRTAVVAGIGFALFLGLTFLVLGIGIRIRLTLIENVGFAMERRLAELAGGVPGVEHLERADYLDKLELLREQHRILGMAFGALVNNFGQLVRFGGTVGLLATLHPVLATLPLFGIPSVVTGGATERIIRRAEDEIAQRQRAAAHLMETATTPGPAKEIRIFGLQDELLRRQGELREEIEDRYARARVRAAIYKSLGWAVFGVGFIGAIAFVSLRAADGLASPGDVLLAVTLASQVNGSVGGLVMSASWLARTLRVVGRFVWLTEFAADASAPPAEPHPAPQTLGDGIAFHDVTFRYPGTERAVLENVSIRIPAGSTVALVGENGAGKTTIVKLLCRFYEPAAGRITVDGVDLASIPADEWRERISAGFQDFAQLELVAQQTIGAGDLPRLDDAAAASGALERAGAPDVLSQLERGLDTQLGKAFGGADLSVGQWQKLALGRAMMRDRPLLLVLDEPTASLDAETEHALFERYARAASERSADGAVTILVSHRFSTVRMADLIIVVDAGGIAEHGTHAELMARGGIYADLYSIQARAYS